MASAATFVAYVDEAGDEGLKFGQGSSEWFVLGAAILRRASEMPEIRLVDDVRARLNRGRKPEHQHPAKKALHFRDLQHEVRKFYAARVAQADLATAVVLIKKCDLLPHYQTPTKQKVLRKHLYHSATVALMETVSHYCAESYKPGDMGDGSVDLVFSSRSTLDYDLLKDLIGAVLADPSTFYYQGKVGTDIIRPAQVQALMHSKSMGLQIADAVASGYFYAVEASADGFMEDAYVRLLLPRACRHEGQMFGSGARFEHCSGQTLEEMRREVTRWER